MSTYLEADILTSKAEVTGLTPRNAKNGIVELTISAYNQDGVLVLTDVTEVIVKCRIRSTQSL